MDAIFINTENGKTNEPNRFRLCFTDKLDLGRNKTIVLANLTIYYTWKNIKSKYNKNKFKIPGPAWSETFDLPDGSYEIQDIQDDILKMINKHEKVEKNEDSSILIYTDGVKNRLSFRIKIGYKLELLTKETQKSLGDGPIIDEYKNSKNAPQLDQVKYFLLHCNIVQNEYFQILNFYMNLFMVKLFDS